MFRSHGSGLVVAMIACLPFVPAASAQTKVAVIDSQRALLETAEIKKAQADLEARFRPRQEEMMKLQKEIEEIQKQLQTMLGKLTPQAQSELSVRGQRKQRELQRMQEDVQADLDRERGDILARSTRQMQEIVSKLADEKGLDIVIDAADTIFHRPTLDLTKEATEAYDRAHPAS